MAYDVLDVSDRRRRPAAGARRRCGGSCKLGYRHEPRLHRRRVRAGAARRAAGRADRAVARRCSARASLDGDRTGWCWSPRSASGASAVAHLVPAGGHRPAPSAGSATRSRSPSSRTWRGCRPRSRPIAHQERPDISTGSSVLRDQVFVLDHMYMSLFSTVRLGPAARRHDRAADVDPPALALLVAVRAADRAARRRGGPASSGAAEERARSPSGSPGTCSRWRRRRRPARRCGSLGIGDAAGAQRRAGVGARGTARSRAPAGSARCGTRWRGRCSVSATSARSCSSRPGSTAPPRRRAAGARRGRAALGLHRRDRRRDRLPARHLDRRLAAAGLARGLRGGAGRPRRPARARPARRRYPARARARSPTRAPTAWCSRTSTSILPAGAVVARRRRERRRQVARWSSCSPRCTSRPSRAHPRRRRSLSRASPPTTGARGWPAPSRTSSASSCAAPAAVGVGDLPRLDDEPRRRARRRPRRAPTTWSSGSRTASTPSSARPGPTASTCRFGQWQKLALARGFMRDEPLLLVLDEPTAALDAETEHALFERYAAAATPGAAASAAGSRILVSHRFSHRAHGRPDRGARRRRASPRSGTHDELMAPRRPVRRALRHAGRVLPLSGRHAEVAEQVGGERSPVRMHHRARITRVTAGPAALASGRSTPRSG